MTINKYSLLKTQYNCDYVLKKNFYINGFNVFSSPFLKIYKLLCSSEKYNNENYIEQKILDYKNAIKEIDKKLSSKNINKRSTIKTQINFTIFIFDYYLKIVFFKKKLKYYLKNKEESLKNLKKIICNFIYFFVSIENFIKYSNFLKLTKKNDLKYCYKIINNFFMTHIKWNLNKIFDLSISYFNNIYIKNLFENFIIKEHYLIDNFKNYLLNKYIEILSDKKINNNLFLSDNNGNDLNKVFQLGKRITIILDNLIFSQNLAPEDYDTNLTFFLEELINPIMFKTHSFLNQNLNNENFSIEKIKIFYESTKLFENFFSDKYSPISFKGLVLKVYKEKINIDYLNYQKECIDNWFFSQNDFNYLEKFINEEGDEDFEKNPFKINGIKKNILESAVDVWYLFSESFRNIYYFEMIKEFRKIWEKEIFIKYGNIYKKHLIDFNFEEDKINLVLESLNWLIESYIDLMKKEFNKDFNSKIIKYYNNYEESIKNVLKQNKSSFWSL